MTGSTSCSLPPALVSQPHSKETRNPALIQCLLTQLSFFLATFSTLFSSWKHSSCQRGLVTDACCVPWFKQHVIQEWTLFRTHHLPIILCTCQLSTLGQENNKPSTSHLNTLFYSCVTSSPFPSSNKCQALPSCPMYVPILASLI